MRVNGNRLQNNIKADGRTAAAGAARGGFAVLAAVLLVAAAGGFFMRSNAAAAGAFSSAPRTDPPEIAWARNFGGIDGDYFEAAATLPGGNAVLAGYSYSNSGNENGWTNNGAADAVAVCVAPDGRILWRKNYGGSGDDKFYAAAVLSDGHIILAGHSSGATGEWGHNGGLDALAVRVNSADGEIVWAKNFGGTSDESFEAAAVLSNGRIVLAGYSGGGSPWGNKGSVDAVAVCVEPGGDTVWARNYGGGGVERFNSAAVLNNGDIILAGRSASVNDEDGWALNGVTGGSFDAIAVCVRPGDGVSVWARNYGGTDDDFFEAVAVLPGGDIILAGRSNSADGAWGDANKGDYDAVAARVTPNYGDVVWSKSFGGSGDDGFNGVSVLQDGGIFLAGYSNGAGGEGLWQNNGGYDAVTVCVEPGGDTGWARNYGGAGEDRIQASAILAGGHIILAGYSASAGVTVDWRNKGGHDALVVKLFFRGGCAVSLSGWTYGDAPNAPRLDSGDYDLLDAGYLASVAYRYTGTTNAGDAYDGAEAPTQAGEYTVAAAFPSDGRYAANVAFADFTIVKARYDREINSVTFENEFVFDGTKKYVTALNLPDGISAVYENDGQTDVGEYEVTVRFVGADIYNYEPIAVVSVILKITAADAQTVPPAPTVPTAPTAPNADSGAEAKTGIFLAGGLSLFMVDAIGVVFLVAKAKRKSKKE